MDKSEKSAEPVQLNKVHNGDWFEKRQRGKQAELEPSYRGDVDDRRDSRARPPVLYVLVPFTGPRR